jgi:phenylalanine-4-hydroxylase
MKANTYISNPVDEKGYVDWSEVENQTWATLFDRQKDIIQGKAADQFMAGLEILNFSKSKVPQIPEINEVLNDYTGWGIEPVPALIQPSHFFTLLSNKRFPAATFIRTPEELDYLQEPDIFHEVYGHTPLLTNNAYGEFMQKFGKLALKADAKDRRRLFRIFWFTIEFGLLETSSGLKAYGGGILSSIGETQYFLGETPEKKIFDVLEVLRTPYRIDIMQPLYFVIKEFDELFTILDQDIMELIKKSKELGDRVPLFEPKTINELVDKGLGAMKC